MEKALKMKERREAIEKEVEEIKARNFEAMKEKCRDDVAKKGERMDFLRRFHEERREALQEGNILRAQEAGKLLPEQIEQTQRGAEGVLLQKNKVIAEQKHQQIVREQNIELKELEMELKSAYAARTVQVQLREREAYLEDEKYRENRAASMKSNWYNDDAIDQYLEETKREERSKYRKDLQDQLVNNQYLRQQRTEESHRERKIVEEVSEILRNEDAELALEKREKIAHVQAEKEASFKAKEIWKCKEKEALLDEFNRQARIISDKITEDRNKAVQSSNETSAKDAMMEKTARQMLDDEVKKKEREFILGELLAEEENKEAVKAFEKAAVKKEIVKQELLADMKRQEQLIADSKSRSAAVDAAFGKYLSEQYETAVRKEKEEQDARRRKNIKHGEDLKMVRDERRALYAEGLLLRQALLRQDDERELQRLEEVSSERSKILQQHVPTLKGFLRPGILRPEDDEHIKTKGSYPRES